MRGLIGMMLLAACSQKNATTEVPDGSLGGADLSPTVEQIRIDVYPSSSNGELLKQSWIADLSDGLTGFDIVLEPTIVISGKVVGYRANPLHSEVPGEDRSPVAATIRVERAGTITGGSVDTDADGDFRLEVPASRGYTVSVTPDDGLRLPFQVSVDNNLSSDLNLETVDLGYGLPVYGHIRTLDGDGLHPLTVRLRDQGSGVAGPATQTDSTGHYLLRAEPGSYTLEVAGLQGSAIPSFSIAATVSEDEGLQLDADIGELLPALVSGQLRGEDDNTALRDITVRLESRALRGTLGTLTIETDTDRDGLFGRQILAGEWMATFIPPYDSSFGGREKSFTVETGLAVLDIGDIELPKRIIFDGFLTDPDGAPLANAAVNAQELGLDGYIFSTTTDDEGGFSLETSPGPMTLTASPARNDLAVSRWTIDPTNSGQIFQVEQGDLMSGLVQGPDGPVQFALIEVRSMAGVLLATSLTDEAGNFAVSLGSL